MADFAIEGIIAVGNFGMACPCTGQFVAKLIAVGIIDVAAAGDAVAFTSVSNVKPDPLAPVTPLPPTPLPPTPLPPGAD